MSKKILGLSALLLVFPVAVFAAEETKSAFHLFYEKTFGPIGAIAGFIAIIALWQLSKKVEKNFNFALKMFVIVLTLVNIASITFGVHGAGIISGEMSRYIERTIRLSALLFADIAALLLYIRIGRGQKDQQS